MDSGENIIIIGTLFKWEEVIIFHPAGITLMANGE